jgi:hypothetical protein
LIQPVNADRTPAEYDGNLKSMNLTDFKPSSSRVGWGQPAFDRVPDEKILLEASGQIFTTGIYAHAPASHVYELGGQWQKLSGRAGLASGHNGTVQFEIKGDGRTLWKSDTVRSDKTVGFEVSVTGVRQIELLTNPTADGSGADWGFWLEPTLKRP